MWEAAIKRNESSDTDDYTKGDKNLEFSQSKAEELMQNTVYLIYSLCI